MSDFRATPTSTGTEAGVRPVSAGPRDDVRARDDQFEHERIGLHNEVKTVRRDRIRCGPDSFDTTDVFDAFSLEDVDVVRRKNAQ